MKDLFFLAGLAAVGWGTWQLSQPAAYIVCGAVLLAVALLAKLRDH